MLLLKVQPGTSGLALVFLIVVNLIPIMAMVAFQRDRARLAGWMAVLPLGIAFIIGTYAHFLSAGTDNVFRMPPSERRLSFQITAVLLAVFRGIRLLDRVSDVSVRGRKRPLRASSN